MSSDTGTDGTGLLSAPAKGRWAAFCPTGGNGIGRQPETHRRDGLDYLGQTGRSLREQMGALAGAYREQVPYRDLHTARPPLWALRHADGCNFEVSTTIVTGRDRERLGLEVAAISLYRADRGASLTANFGRLPGGYRGSSGNYARLVAVRRQRGGPDPIQPAAPPSGLTEDHCEVR